MRLRRNTFSRSTMATICMAIVGIAIVGLWSSSATSCPFCSAPALSLTEQLSQNDAAIVCKWVKADKDENEKTASTTYEIVRILKAPKKETDAVNVGDKITLARYRKSKPNETFLILGVQGPAIEWGVPLEVDKASVDYIANAPSPDTPTAKRLVYFLKYLEHKDDLVSNDAYAEFAAAPYKDVAKIHKEIPRDNIRKWVKDPETNPTRLGLYGLMLGLCGNKDDIKLMEEKITAKTEDFRLGIDGVMYGYLILAKEKGLKVLEKTKLQDKEVPFSETYAAMQAMRYVWRYHPDHISKKRLRQAMRLLLERPEYADLVIADLSRWQDWEVQDRLMEIYDDEAYSIPSVKRAIIRYMFQCAKFKPSDKQPEPPKHAVKAKRYLDTLRAKDPKFVQDVERYIFD